VQHSASSPTPSFDKTSYSTTDPASPWVVVNKQHPLQPKTYIPDDLVTPTVPLRVPGNESMQLRSTTAKALESMFAVAKTDNINLMISSGYRSYTYQVSLYGSYVSSMGQARADTQSARPGFSEHQTGQALDIEPTSRKCEVAQCFADTPEGKWLVANAYRYGFILRYTPADVAVTGYESEPWHYRYVGIPLATEMHKTGVATLEQFFGVSGGQNY
jgi:D-alanyl-D-alanine carboxypeptidase